MRDYNSAELAYLQGREGFRAQLLVWVEPRDRATGSRVGMGFWSGEEDASFTIAGVSRAFAGGGALAGVDPIVMRAGLEVRFQRITLQPLFETVALMLRGYDAWRAPIRIYRALFNPASNALVAEPRQLWKGLIDSAPIQTPAIGGESSAEVSLASAAEALTHGLTLTRSDAIQSQRGGDRFYRYKDVSGSVSVSWGENRA